MPRQPLPMPVRGLSDNEGYADQIPGTTQEAVNVRGIDPITGRTRLSQRAGMTKYNSAQIITGGKVDAISPVTYDVPRVKYTQETTGHETMWSARPAPGNGSWSVQTDRQGNVFVVTVNGTVFKYNSAGEYVTSITPPLEVGYGSVPVLDLDEIDGIYIAAKENVGDSTGKVWKFAPTEKPDGSTGYDKVWTIDHGSGIADIAVRGGTLVVLGDGISTDEQATLTAYISIFTTTPLKLWTTTVPTPANAVVINSSGEVLVTSEPNATRGALGTTTDWGAESIQWSPHEEFESETRLHSWVDAKQIPNQTNLESQTIFEDRRYLATDLRNTLSASNHIQYGQPGAFDYDNANVHSNDPTDQLPARYLDGVRAPVNASKTEWTYAAPNYGVGLFDDYPYLSFLRTIRQVDDAGDDVGTNTGQALQSRLGDTYFKADDGDSSGTNATSRSFLPAHDPYISDGAGTGYGNGFTFSWFMVLEEPSTNPQVVWAAPATGIAGGVIGYACIYNARYTAGAWAVEAGTLSLLIEDTRSTPIVKTFSITVNETAADPSWDTTGRRVAICTMVHPGHNETVAANADYDDRFVFRVNGIHVGRDTVYSQKISAISTITLRTTFGGAKNNTDDVSAQALSSLNEDFSGTKLYNRTWTGHLMEMICLLHPDDGADPNALDTGTSFGAGWGTVQPVLESNGKAPAALGDDSGTLLYTDYAGDEEAYTQSATTVERLEGYLAHAWGSADALPDDGDTSTADGLFDTHPFGGTRVPKGAKSGYNGYGTTTGDSLNSPDGILSKYSGSSGAAIWAKTGAGIGYGVTLDSEDNPMCVGPQDSTTPEYTIARKLIDNGDTVSEDDTDGAWELGGATDGSETQNNRLCRLTSDSNGDLYWPVSNTNGTPTVKVISEEDGTELYDIVLSNGAVPYSLAFPPVLPYYGDETITGPEYCYISTDGGHDTLYKVELVSQVQAVDGGQSLRRNDVCVIGHGDIKLISDGVVTTPGSGSLSTRAPYAQMVQLFGKVYITDGESYKVLDPKLGTVEDWTATDGGEMPARGRILTAWRGRIIISRAADDPYEIYASELGNPLNWDIYPAALTTTQAWRGRASGVGRAPDIVNCFIPLTDDLALIGGDHSIYRMTGDPAAGGQIDVLTDQVGIAYGDSWTKDPDGRLYFFSSRGGVYGLDASGAQVRLSNASIERRLQDIDLTEYKVNLVWDYRLGGLYVLPVPWTIGGVKRRSYFWEQKTASWWEDEQDISDLQPSAACILDGDDPGDRLVLFGCEDGYVRKVDESNANDDTNRIDSRLLVGPLVPPGTDLAFRFTRPQVTLASDQDGARYEMYSSSVADIMGDSWAAGELWAGRSPFLTGRTRGAAVWLRVRSAKLGERWSLEDATIAVEPAGRARVR